MEEGLSLQGAFWFKFNREVDDGNFIIDIYDSELDHFARLDGPDFAETLRHALHYADPLLAAWAFGPEHLAWTEVHKLKSENK